MYRTRRSVRFLARFAAGALAAALLLLAAVALFPSWALRGSAGAARAALGIYAESGRVSGNFVSGFVVRDFRLSLPQADVYVPEVVLHVKWLRLLRREFVVESLELVSPHVALRTRRPAAAPRPAGPPSRWSVELRRLSVRDGSVFWEDAPREGWRRAGDIRLDVRFVDGRADIRRAEVRALDSFWRAHGRLDVKPLNWDVAVTAEGDWQARLETRGSPDDFRARLAATWREALIWADARRAGLRFSGLAAARNVRLEKISPPADPAAPPLIAPLSARARFNVTGRGPADARGTARVVLQVEGGPAADVAARLAGRAVAWTARFSGGGVSGDARGRAAPAGISARWSLRARAEGMRAWTRAIAGDFASAGRLDGTGPRSRWKFSLDASNASFRDARLDSGSVQASGRGVPPLALRASAEVRGLKQGDRTLDSAAFEIDGGTRAHRMSARVASGDNRLALRGRGSLDERGWSARWSSLTAHAGTDWAATRPFRTRVGGGGFLLSGFAARSGAAVVTAEAALPRAGPGRIRLDLAGFDTGPWAEAGLWLLPANAVIDARVVLVRDAGRWSGPFRLRAQRLSFRKRAMGTLDGRGRLAGDRAVVDALEWNAPGGTLVFAGTVPVAAAPDAPPDFDVHMTARNFDFSFFTEFFSEGKMEGARLDGDLRLRREAGRLSPAGRLVARTGRTRVPAIGAEWNELVLDLRGEEGGLRVAEGSVRAGKGTLSLSGRLAREGPALRLDAAKFPFRVPGDYSGQVAGFATWEGKWGAPVVRGDVRLEKADYRPAKKKKKKGEKKIVRKKPPAEAPPPGLLAMDLRVSFDRDVWYKDGSNGIEMKGDLSLRKDPYEALRLYGSVETIRGEYSYYGRTFTIREGLASFTGSAPPDPQLRVAAQYLEENSGTRVNLDVSGTVSRPVLALSSQPPLSEQDIIALLLFGRPLDGSENAGGPKGRDAAEELMANYLLQQGRKSRLVQKLDLDVLKVKKTGAGDTDLTVGRYLSRDLFVSYDQTVGVNGQRRLNAEYTLSRHFSLFGRSSSDDRYIVDFLFRYGLW